MLLSLGDTTEFVRYVMVLFMGDGLHRGRRVGFNLKKENLTGRQLSLPDRGAIWQKPPLNMDVEG